MQSKWKAILDQIIQIPMLNGRDIVGVQLIGGVPKTINHLLGRKQQGWFLTDINADTNVWHIGLFNDKTITLQSSATTTINLRVY